MSDLRISQLAELSGVPASTLRFYENVGLLPAGRSPGGYRVFDEVAVERLAFIGTAKRLGLPLEEISELLQVWAQGSCSEVRDDLRPRLEARIADAERRAAELAAFTATLHQAAEHLDALPDREERCDPDCGILAPQTAAKQATTALSVTTYRDREAWRTAPVACTLSGGGMQERVEQWRALLDGGAMEPIPDGLRLTLPADRAGRIAELAVAEQQCCAFFDFRLHLRGATVEVEVRAPGEAAQFLADLFSSGAGSDSSGSDSSGLGASGSGPGRVGG